MLDAALTTISRYSMLGPGDRVIAAVSGGPDSVCLLEALREIAPRAGFRLAGVAHVNHKLRGEASEEDERFVAGLAESAGVPFYRKTAAIGKALGNLEQAARRARLNFFASLIRDGKTDRVATGHTRDDQAETVLFRLLRGSGLAGLAGILPVTREGLIRPLLEVSRAEAQQFLRGRGIGWREDSSNAETRFARNRIRLGLLPQLEREWNPRIRDVLARLADLAGEEEHWWQEEIGRIEASLMEARDGGLEIRADALEALPKAAARRLIRHMIRRAGGKAPEFDHVEKVLKLAKDRSGSGCIEAAGAAVVRSFDWLRVEANAAARRLPETAQVQVPGRCRWDAGAVCFELIRGGEQPAKPRAAGCVRLKGKGGSASTTLELRGWKDGDRYRPWGRSQDQNIQEMFQRARVPSWRRASWPIVTDGRNILWVRDFGPAAEAIPEPGADAVRIWEEKNAGS